MLEIDLMAEAEKRFSADVVEVLRKYRRRMIYLHIAQNAEQEAQALPGCWFGGQPTLPDDLPWPIYTRSGYEFPMSFVGQFDCAALPKLEEYPIPEKGTLFFFYEFGFHHLRGMSGEEEYIQGGCVYHTEKDWTTLAPVARPAVSDPAPHRFADLFDEEPSGIFGASPTWKQFLEIIENPALPLQKLVPVLTDDFQLSLGLSKVHQQFLVLNKYKDRTIEDHFNYKEYRPSCIFGADYSTHRYHSKMDVIPLLVANGPDDPFADFVSIVEFLIPRADLIARDFSKTFIGRDG